MLPKPLTNHTFCHVRELWCSFNGKLPLFDIQDGMDRKVHTWVWNGISLYPGMEAHVLALN
jgi:hypothetical protein